MSKYTFFAFSKGKMSTEGIEVKRYIGIAPCFVLAVNPNKKELESLYNTTIENEPSYISEVEVGQESNKHKVPQVRLDFIIKTNEEKCGHSVLSKIAFFLTKEARFNKDYTKVQVIDKYGRTAWVTKEQLANHEIPMYSNGPANLDKDYRPCYIGEEDLTNFIKTYLRIPNVMKYIDNTWVMVDNPSDSEARLDGIDSYFKGDFNELRNVIAYQPQNQVKVMFGVRTTDDNKLYQAVYNQRVLNNNATDYSKLEAEYLEKKNNGAFNNVEFSVCDLKEYSVESTNFASIDDDLPEDNSSSPWFAQ